MTEEQNKKNAIASLVLGLCSLILLWIPLVTIVSGILGIVFYGIQKKKHGSTGMATAGLVLSIIALSLYLLMIMVVGLMFTAIGLA